MKIEELHPSLQRPYVKGQDGGKVTGIDPHHPQISFIIPPLPPTELSNNNFSVKLMSEASSALNKLASYDEMDELDKLINYLFVRREAVQSSRMEGTWSTIDAVLTPTFADDSQYEDSTLSVRGYAHALEDIFEQAHLKKEKIFSIKTLCHIHSEIMKKDSRYFGVPGHMRSQGEAGSIVYIGGILRPEDSIYNPAPAEYVKECMDKVIAWYSDIDLATKGDAGVGMNLITRIAIGHTHLEAIHPFPDGNGRVGRALWPLQMIASGTMPLYLSGYVEKEKQAYYEALQLAQKKLDYSKMIDFISSAIISSFSEMKVSKEKIRNLPVQWNERGEFRKHSTAQRSLDVILQMPIFTMGHLREVLGCSGPAAANAVDQLLKKKIIRERTGFKRNRIFAAEEVIAILSRDHGSNIDLSLEYAQRLMSNK